jgi:hypothetical protein
MSMKKARFGDFMNTFIADDTRSVAGKSGGADSGTAGEMRSKLGKSDVVEKKKIKNYIKKKVEQGKTVIKKTKEAAKKTGTILATPIKKFHEAAEENVRKNGPVRIFKRSYSKGGGMSVGQAKLAAKAPPPNKIDAKDFAVLRAEKAKGRGMGLQDEKIKPGKVMKANKGRFSKIPLAGKATSVGSTTMKGMKFSEKAKMVDAGKINKATGKFTSMEALRESIGYRPGESTDNFNKRRMALAAAKKAAKATTIGKIVLPIAAAGVAAQQYLKSKMNKKKDVEKKMGGGMMKKYSVGGGADSGNVGEMKSRIAVAVDRLKKAKKFMGRGSGPMGDRLTDNDMEKIKNLVGKNKAARPIQRKMGGGMMKKPMGYKHGTYAGKGPLGGAGQPARGLGALGAIAAKEISADNKRRIAYMDGAKETVTGGGMKADRFREGLNIKGSKDSAMKYYARGDTDHGKLAQKNYKKMKNNTYSKGGMMKPSGYRTGTFVKARGCKLGRTRPTKIT